MKPLYILNGPNLNLLGVREPHIYGHTTLAQIDAMCDAAGKKFGMTVTCRQSNFEGQLVEWVHEARAEGAGIVINPAGYSFTSIALLDALKASDLPIVEVHISNIHRREEIYHHSLVSKAATIVICGAGPLGYELAITALAARLRDDQGGGRG